ncbi:hypothetical protein DFH07DRAFT_783893 [Mycena maculata]|uniref:Uncharacterized protein n=1 Tax=Mycena maculata TaxID=230809 RepID=A0AAD7HKU5_9AGAR|nr:hypothetical protein DFH07DRAFT_783893 [Mycena maculata]
MVGSKKAPIWWHFHELPGQDQFQAQVSTLLCMCQHHAREEEEAYMRVMAELDEQDDALDDGEIEIDDGCGENRFALNFAVTSQLQPTRIISFLGPKAWAKA